MKYYIVYTVPGFEGTHKAGPYEEREVDSQRRDIEGYGAQNLRVVPEGQEPIDPKPLRERLDHPVI